LREEIGQLGNGSQLFGVTKVGLQYIKMMDQAVFGELLVPDLILKT